MSEKSCFLLLAWISIRHHEKVLDSNMWPSGTLSVVWLSLFLDSVFLSNSVVSRHTNCNCCQFDTWHTYTGVLISGFLILALYCTVLWVCVCVCLCMLTCIQCECFYVVRRCVCNHFYFHKIMHPRMWLFCESMCATLNI